MQPADTAGRAGEGSPAPLPPRWGATAAAATRCRFRHCPPSPNLDMRCRRLPLVNPFCATGGAEGAAAQA